MKIYIKVLFLALVLTVAAFCGSVSMASAHCSCEANVATVAQCKDLPESVAFQTAEPERIGLLLATETLSPEGVAPIETESPVMEETQTPETEACETEPPHVHSYSPINTVAPGCECDGYTVYECSCGSGYSDDYTSATGHSWGDWVTVKEPTADVAGEESRECVKCGECEVESVFMAAAPVEPELEDVVAAGGVEGVEQEEVQEDVTESEDKPAASKGYDYIGRWSISSVGVDVAVYGDYYVETAPGSGDYVLLKKRQARVDDVDSAVYFEFNGVYIIGDHNYQGFDAIKQCTVGTTAYLDGVVNAGSYHCVAVIQGHNTKYDLTDRNYVSICTLYPGATVCYTCNENDYNVTIVVFYPA